MSNPKLNFKEETSAKKTRSPPKKARVEQSTPKKKKLKLDADKAAEKNQHHFALRGVVGSERKIFKICRNSG